MGNDRTFCDYVDASTDKLDSYVMVLMFASLCMMATIFIYPKMKNIPPEQLFQRLSYQELMFLRFSTVGGAVLFWLSLVYLVM